jgi:nitroreductase
MKMSSDQRREAFQVVLATRRSVREFSPDDVSEEILVRILETGRRAASAANRQPWYFVVARKAENHPLYGLLEGRNLGQAPLLIAGLADRARAWTRRGDGVNYAWVDVTIALTEMILAATAEGLGTCWIAAFDDARARAILGLPPEVEPVCLVALGWPREPLLPVEKDRRGLDEIVRRGTWRP